MVPELLIAGRRFGIRPSHRFVAPIADEGVEVAGCAVELAPGGADAAWDQKLHAHVIRRDVDRRWVARVEHLLGTVRVGEGLAGEFDADVAWAGFDRRRAWIVPDVLYC